MQFRAVHVERSVAGDDHRAFPGPGRRHPDPGAEAVPIPPMPRARRRSTTVGRPGRWCTAAAPVFPASTTMLAPSDRTRSSSAIYFAVPDPSSAHRGGASSCVARDSGRVRRRPAVAGERGSVSDSRRSSVWTCVQGGTVRQNRRICARRVSTSSRPARAITRKPGSDQETHRAAGERLDGAGMADPTPVTPSADDDQSPGYRRRPWHQARTPPRAQHRAQPFQFSPLGVVASDLLARDDRDQPTDCAMLVPVDAGCRPAAEQVDSRCGAARA